MQQSRISLSLALILTCIAVTACDRSPDSATPAKSTPTTDGASVKTAALDAIIQSAPAPEALSPADAKQAAKPGEPITVTGRIGGSMSPIMDGRAVFTIVGDALLACSDTPSDTCTTPWDYCCETKADLAKHMATVQIVDEQGSPLRADIAGKHGLKELAQVVVEGTVASADGPNLVINATRVYVNPSGS